MSQRKHYLYLMGKNILKINEIAVNIAKDAIDKERSLKKRIFIAGSFI